jgi:hypothetical protein
METVPSADGTVIAFDRSGDGPELILVLGRARCTLLDGQTHGADDDVLAAVLLDFFAGRPATGVS